MKKYLSVFMLMARSSIYPVLLVILGIAAVEAAIFFPAGMGAVHLERALGQVPFFEISCAALILLSIILATQLCDRGGKLNNTLQRLSISEQMVFWVQAVYNASVFLLLFLVQALTFIGLSYCYDTELFSGPAVLVTAYQHPLFHTFFPLDNMLAIATNLVIITGLGICTAAFPMRQRHNRQSIMTFLMLLAACFYLFLQGEGRHMDMGNQIMIILVTLYCMIVALCGTMSLEVDDNE